MNEDLQIPFEIVMKELLQTKTYQGLAQKLTLTKSQKYALNSRSFHSY